MSVMHCTLENNQAIINFSATSPLSSNESMFSNYSNLTSYRGLIDTGAQRTCFTHRVINEVPLIRHGHKPLKTIDDQWISRSLYFTSIGFWVSSEVSNYTNDTSNTYFALPNPLQVYGINNNETFDALIGMDILSMFNFSFNRQRQEFEIKLKV